MKNSLIYGWLVVVPVALVALVVWGEEAATEEAPKTEAVEVAAAEAAPAVITTELSGRATTHDYPLLNDVELMDRLEAAGLKMLEEKTGLGSKDLNAGLECKDFELKLADVREESLADEELYQRACESIYVVCGLFKSEDGKEWDAAFATAFVVGSDGVLTTSRHFFDDPQPCEVFLVVDMAGKIHPVTEILCSDKDADTCLFRIPAQDLKPLPLAKKAPMPGSRVRIVSHPGYFFYFFSSGQVANYFKDDDGLKWMNVTADFGQGSSGAPAFDDCGNVVGQVSSTLTLYAIGPPVEDPIVSRRHVSRSVDGKVRVTAAREGKAAKEKKEKEPAPADEGKTPKKKKKKKDKQPEKIEIPLPLPDEMEMADPQMVFKTCTPLEGLRGMVK